MALIYQNCTPLMVVKPKGSTWLPMGVGCNLEGEPYIVACVHHQTVNPSVATISRALSIVHLVNAECSCLCCCLHLRADVAYNAATSKEQLACLRVLNEVNVTMLLLELSCAHL